MSNIPRGLGRGLDALFGDNTSSQKTSAPAMREPSTSLPLDKIIPNPNQPRRHFAKEALEELAASIRQQGLIQPLLVRPRHNDPGRYEIVAGERRWRAAGLAGIKDVPVLVRELTDEEVMAAALIENLQREDLNPIEEALALHALREHCALTQEQLAARIGKSRPAIANALRLLQLSPTAQQDVQFGRIHAGHARALLSLDNPEAQETLREAIVARQMNVRDTEAAAAVWKQQGIFPWIEVSASDTADTTDSTETETQPSSSEETSATEKGAAEIPPPPRSGTRTKSPLLKAMQKELGDHLSLKVSVSGNEERGRITLTYTNAQELTQLLSQWGMTLVSAEQQEDVSPSEEGEENFL